MIGNIAFNAASTTSNRLYYSGHFCTKSIDQIQSYPDYTQGYDHITESSVEWLIMAQTMVNNALSLMCGLTLAILLSAELSLLLLLTLVLPLCFCETTKLAQIAPAACS